MWKFTDTGEVEFRIHVVSRPATIPNPVVRLGFHLFGRREQVRFARHACEPMACLLAGEKGLSSTLREVTVRERATV